MSDDDELPEELQLGGGPAADAVKELNDLFSKGFTVPMALRMNSVYGKSGVRQVEAALGAVGHRAENGDWVVPYVMDIRRLHKLVEDEIRIIRGEARVT